MTDDHLNELIVSAARHIARAQELPLEQVIPRVQCVLTAALQEYRGAGTPYGDDFAGFARYLSQGDLPQRPSPTGPAGSH
jgi:hypothetical protein